MKVHEYPIVHKFFVEALGYGRIVNKIDRAEEVHERGNGNDVAWQGDGGVVYKRSPLEINDLRHQIPSKISYIFQT